MRSTHLDIPVDARKILKIVSTYRECIDFSGVVGTRSGMAQLRVFNIVGVSEFRESTKVWDTVEYLVSFKFITE